MVLEDIPPADPSFSDYSIDYLLAESANSFYATIYDFIDEPLWIPKSVVDDYWRIKHWFIRQLTERKRTWKKKEKNYVQQKLFFLISFSVNYSLF